MFRADPHGVRPVIVTIHQPEHLPYFGFLDKVNKSDIFVILDDVQFKKNSFQNRNQILTPNGPKWLSIPVEMKNLENKDINAREVKGEWKQEYRNKIVEAYRKHPFFDENIVWIDELLALESDLLIDYNMFAIRKIFELAGINTKIIFSSELGIHTFKTQRLFDICLRLNATGYLAGQGAIDYLDTDVFKGINVLRHTFVHPEYPQDNSETFVPYMSSLDFLMNVGTTGLRKMLEVSRRENP